MHKNRSGFTIVELLIVIVVIGILAAITIVAYNGIQQRAKSAKTVGAVSAWVKAIKIYEADKGSLPSADSCLGSLTTYSGSASSCWEVAYWQVNQTFLNMLQPYMDSRPEPDVTNIGTDATPRRGAFYYAGARQIYVMFAGATSCPAIGGLSLANQSVPPEGPNGMTCVYAIQ